MEIPETVWAEAKAFVIDDVGEYGEITAFAVARAIMAERDRCAELVESYGTEKHKFFDDELEEYVLRKSPDAFEISQAIRNPLHKQT